MSAPVQRGSAGRAIFSTFAMLVLAAPAAGQGSVVPAAGAVNRSMAGAAVAAPLEPAGALYWNPATLAGLAQQEMVFTSAVYYGSNKLTSTLPADAFGPGVPPVPLSGQSRSDAGVGVLPTFAIHYRPEDSPWDFGFGAFTGGGFFNNYPSTAGNPILSPPPPSGFGSGAIFTSAGFGQLVAAASCRLTDRLAFALGPVVSSATIQASPGSFAPPNADGRFPAATNTRMHWGLGCVAGLYYVTPWNVNLGASLKSTQWFEQFEYNAVDALGFDRRLQLDVDFPMVVSIGAAYTGLERCLFAVDLRYIDFRNTDTFGTPAGFDAAGAVTGAGWRSVFAVASGAQYQVSDRLSARLGYLFTQNPTPDEVAFFNVAGAAIYQHLIALGATYAFSERLKVSAAWVRVLPHSITGPFLTPAGPVPGSAVRIDQFADAIDIGLSVSY